METMAGSDDIGSEEPHFDTPLPDVNIDLLVEEGFNTTRPGNAQYEIQLPQITTGIEDKTALPQDEGFFSVGVDAGFSPRDISNGKAMHVEKNDEVPFFLAYGDTHGHFGTEPVNMTPREHLETINATTAISSGEGFDNAEAVLQLLDEDVHRLPEAPFTGHCEWQDTNSSVLPISVSSSGEESPARMNIDVNTLLPSIRATEMSEPRMLPVTSVEEPEMISSIGVAGSRVMHSVLPSRPILLHGGMEKVYLKPVKRPMKNVKRKGETKKHERAKAKNGVGGDGNSSKTKEGALSGKSSKKTTGRRRVSLNALVFSNSLIPCFCLSVYTRA